MTRVRLSALGAAALVLAVGAIGLTGCGRLGGLEQPGPIFGHGKPTAAGATTAPGATVQKRAEQPDPNRPVRTVDPRDESATPAPPRTLPIPGQGPLPNAPAPQGALPDPYANPPR
jgi:hypothetical protein